MPHLLAGQPTGHILDIFSTKIKKILDWYQEIKARPSNNESECLAVSHPMECRGTLRQIYQKSHQLYSTSHLIKLTAFGPINTSTVFRVRRVILAARNPDFCESEICVVRAHTLWTHHTAYITDHKINK